MIDHINEINRLAHAANGPACIAKFALLTIRVQFQTLPVAVASVINEGSASRFVWGFKRQSFQWLASHQAKLAGDVAQSVTDCDLMAAYMQVPGLGLAKAGFCSQMTRNRVGCLDYLNEQLYGVTVPRTPKTLSPGKIAQRIKEYVDTCAEIGDSTALWTKWCDTVGQRRQWRDGEAVSQTHVNLIKALIRSTT